MGDTNNRDNDIAIIRNIRNALRLNENECDIIPDNSFYIIRAANRNSQLHITHITSSSIFGCYNLIFENCVFECEVPIIGEINKSLMFGKCSFNKRVHLLGSFKDRLMFFRSTFNKKLEIQFSNFEKGILFSQSIFKDNVLFLGNVFCEPIAFDFACFEGEAYFISQFRKETLFTGATFKKRVGFGNNSFHGNAYFDNAKFHDAANFYMAKFNKIAYFYGAQFDVLPFFVQTIFNEKVNLINTNLILNFQQLRNDMPNIYCKHTTTKSAKEHEVANEFRDTFRAIKSALISDNNLIEASKFHKMELYCKEIELEHKKEEVAGTNIRDFVERIQLMFYRLTSDHHTNLLLILNHTIFLIALFGLANLILIPFGEIYATMSLLSAQINIIEIALNLIFVAIAIYFIFDYCKVFIFCISITSYLAALIVSPLYCAPLFVFTLLCFLNFKQCVFILSYFIAAFMLFSNPSSILPILGKLIENKSAEVCLFVVGNVKLLCCSGNSSTSETLNLIYMLFLFLLLWSLQKTARKNTIVPS